MTAITEADKVANGLTAVLTPHGKTLKLIEVLIAKEVKEASN